MNPISATLVATGSCVMLAVAASADQYQIDPVHSITLFRVKHVDAGYIYGVFTGVTGEISFDPQAPEKASIAVAVKTTALSTFNADRDTHLKSPDFFNVEKSPDMAFKSTSCRKVGDHTYEITGDFTLLGVTKRITFKADHTGVGKGMKGETRAGFEAVFTIKRSDFGMIKFLPTVVADEVTLTISLEGVKP